MRKPFTIPAFLLPAYFPSLDGLRALSITLVLFAHLSNPFKVSTAIRNSIVHLGVLGVQVFFVISGFLITTLLLKEKVLKADISLKDFYFRRLLRIMPVAFLYLLCIAVLNAFFHLNIPLRCFVGATFFVANLAYFQGSWYTAHYWSLSIEEQYYLVFPLLLKRFTRKIHLFLVFAILIIIGLRTWAYSFTFPDSALMRTIGFLIYQSDGVLIGSLMAVLCFKRKLPLKFLERNGVYISIVLPICIWLFHSGIIGYDSVNPAISCVLIALFILCCMICRHSLLYNLLNHKYIMWLGRLSFSIYIWQQLFTSTDGKFGPFTKLPLNVLLLAVTSYCSYFLFEKRFLLLKEKFSRPGSPKPEIVNRDLLLPK